MEMGKKLRVNSRASYLPLQVAEGALFALRHLAAQRGSYGIPEGLHPTLPWYLQLEDAKLHWARGESALATGRLKTILRRMEHVR